MKRSNKRKAVYTVSAEYRYLFTLFCCVFLMVSASAAWSQSRTTDSDYTAWKRIGIRAGGKAKQMLRREVPHFNTRNCLALTNAGYAEVHEQSTMGALDGLTTALKVSRGNHSLVEVQSAPTSGLWFAVYDTASGWVAYLEVNSDAVREKSSFNSHMLFSTAVAEQINAEHLYEHATEYAEKFDNAIFNGNEFRIVTIVNALSAGVSTAAIRAFEFHDHYCPGVTSGILLADYIKRYFPLASGGSYFVQGIQPWCKEDALMVLLNTTPGKKSYAVTYPTAEDIASWPTWASNLSTVVYRYDKGTETWGGLALGYTWGETGCPDYGHAVMNKLCTDLWYLDRMDQPEQFITVLKQFTLPLGTDPKEYARPGVDPVLLIDNLN
ncbi:MAG: FmdE family protein [Candidatus Electrothrix scaldis]|nr:MAG: FmdE family protein [Candidatus Electrothrix sp. GW3-3]